MIYVLRLTNSPDDEDKGMLNRVTLVGPFASVNDASAWGADDANIPYEDEPDWQIVNLDEPPTFVMKSVP